MREIAVCVLMITTGLAGCLGDDADPVDENQGSLSPSNASSQPAEAPDGNATTSGPTANQTGADATERGRGDENNLTAHTVFTGFQGGEPTIGLLPPGTIFVQAMDDTIRSTDRGKTWESVYEYSFETVTGTVGTGDPMLWTDPATERVYWNHLRLDMTGVACVPFTGCAPNTLCTAIGWSDDAGESWERNDRACVTNGADFQKLGGGPPGPEPNPMAGVGHPTVLYLCYNSGDQGVDTAGVQCATSYDGGQTWPVEGQLSACSRVLGGPLNCGSLSGRPVVAQDGTAYVPMGFTIGVSTDSGLTWLHVSAPEMGENGWRSVRELAATPDGTLYAIGTSADRVAFLARSSDGGNSWDGPWRVSPPDFNHTIFFFSALEAGDDGRVAVALLGTSASIDNHRDAPDDTRWHLHIVVSEDADTEEPTFRHVRATEDPVQVGSICLGGGCGEDRNLLDFIDAAVAPDGTFYVSYTDGCTGECATMEDPSPEDSRDSATAVAWLEGWRLR